MKLELDQVVTQLKAFLLKNRSNLSEDDLKLLDDIIHQLNDISSISDPSIRKSQLGKCCNDILKFLRVALLVEKASEILEEINDYI